MRKFRIYFIIGATAISMVGLIMIQAYWIQVALRENEHKFNMQVNQALQRVVDRLEKEDTYEYLEEIAGEDSMNSTREAQEEKAEMNDSIRRQKFVSIPPGAAGALSSLKIWVSDTDHPNLMLMDNKILLQSKLNMLRGIVIDMVQRQKPLKDRLNYKQIHHYLQQEFNSRNLNTPFQYGILQGTSHHFVYTGESGDVTVNNLKRSTYKAALFPTDLFSRQSGFLVVSFPEKDVYILKRIIWDLVLSSLFILIIIYSFYWIVHNLFRQKKLSAMKTDFINNMTHELKTPISTISLATQILTDKDSQSRVGLVDKFAAIIAQENKRLQTHVERVLQIAKLDKGQIKLEKETIDVMKIIEDVAGKVKMRVQEKKGDLSLSLEPDSAIMLGDPMHITNVIWNLTDNAIKYSSSSPQIEIAVRKENEELRIDVTDHGIGMSKEQQKRVFDKFYRVPTGNLHDVKGFGLGLSYVKTIVEEHGGHVAVKSSPGKGSTFTVFLPLKNN